MLGLKGIWIPIEILSDEKLLDKEKIVYSLILYLCKDSKTCYCTNENLMKILNISKVYSTKLIRSLKEKNYINIKLNYYPNSKKIKSRIIIPLRKINRVNGISQFTTRGKPEDTISGKPEFNDNKIYNKNNYKNNASMFSYEQRTYSKEELENLYAN